MFGKPEWFRERLYGWTLQPITKQGWIYFGLWLAAILLPAFTLLLLSKRWEAGIWLCFSIIGLLRDQRLILLALRPPAEKPVDNVLYIDDDQTPVGTRNFDLHLRR